MSNLNEIKDFNRTDLFHKYNSRANPFLIITTKVDITNIVNYCKIHKNYYATIAYFITKSVNSIDNFKYFYKDTKFYKYEYLNPGFTQKFDDDTIGFFDCEINQSYNDYIKQFNNTTAKFFDSNKSIHNNQNENAGQIWLSCLPWFKFTSLIPPFDKDIMIPQFIWDKFDFVDNKCYINLMVFAHHGFVDGYHIGLFINKLNKLITDIDNICI